MSAHRRPHAGATCLVSGLALVGATIFWPNLAHAKAPTNEVTVEINDFAFSPPTLSVPVGTVVTWINKDEAPHTVVEAARGFKSRVLETGEKFSFTVSAPGSFSYFCSLHPHMTARLVVEAPTP